MTRKKLLNFLKDGKDECKFMETRMVREGRVYVLCMNPISGRAEDVAAVAACSDYQRLVQWYNDQRCEMWRDDWMNKQFKQGSSLEYYNPIWSTELNPNDYWHHGVYDEWMPIDDNGNL